MYGLMTHDQALRQATNGLAHGVLESIVVLLFAWSMSLDAFWPVMFFVLSVSGGLFFWWVIRMGWTRRLADPSLLLPRYVLDWTLQISFTLLLPSLTVIFLLALLVRYNQAMIHFSRRQFTLSWLILGITLSGALCHGRRALAHPGVDSMDIFLLWVFFVLCLFRLTATGRMFSALREELTQRNDLLSTSAARLRAVSDRERLQERERLARQLHENLLQELQGLLMNFHTAADRIPRGMPAKQQMQAALEQAEQVLASSHESVLGLQATDIAASGLSQALADVACELSRDHAATFRIRTRREPRALQHHVADEAFRIAREALVNAFQHANATRVDVMLRFDDGAFSLRVSDNGKGMSAELIDRGRQDHWGLGIMRDRARKLGGRLRISSSGASRGTAVCLRIPAPAAYLASRAVERGRWARMKRQFAALFGLPDLAAPDALPHGAARAR